MTIWSPQLEDAGPVYLEITRALESDIREGRLQAGDRLPPHRELAAALGVNVGTVSRAYAEARRRGLVRGEVGRGTYVQPPGPLPFGAAVTAPDEAGPIDMSTNVPLRTPAPDLAAALHDLAASAGLDALVAYGDPSGSPAVRAAGAAWLAGLGVDVTPDRVAVCAGAQHAILTALAGVVGPGEVVLAEALTYPGFLGAARLLGLRVRGVALDEHGIVPESLEQVCRSERPRLLYTMPGVQNPTAVRLSDERRRRIATLARRHDLTLVQDDVQNGLVDDPGPSLAALAPERVLTIASLSKNFVPGLRIAFLAGEALDVERAREVVWSSIWMASSIGAEIARRWIEDGTGHALLAERREEMRVRHALAARILHGLDYVTRPGSYHLWLPLPPGWSNASFTAELARRHDVRVSSADAFLAQRGEAPRAVRISISGPVDHAQLEVGLRAIRELVVEGPRTTPPYL